MKDIEIGRFLRKVEKTAKDEITLFLEVGESFYSLKSVERLQEKWKKQFAFYTKWRNRSILMSSSSFMWMPIAFLAAAATGSEIVFTTLIVLFPISLVLGFIIVGVLYYKYGRMMYQEKIGAYLAACIEHKKKTLDFQEDDYLY